VGISHFAKLFRSTGVTERTTKPQSKGSPVVMDQESCRLFTGISREIEDLVMKENATSIEVVLLEGPSSRHIKTGSR